ncbi:MAG TPA: hypothetical protein VNA14_13590 [Mycobacteriales bacterium]|nr:hypothetical protein [Mycobacteriales bacterium]
MTLLDRARSATHVRARRTAMVVLAVALCVGCSGGDGKDAAPAPSAASASASSTKAPAASKKASPTGKPSPPPRAVPMETTGALLSATSEDAPINADPQSGCFDAYPAMLDVVCDTITLAGGTVLWVSGTEDAGGGVRRQVMRLHVFDEASGGYRLRFVARDGVGDWTGFRVGPARLTGHGVDGLVMQVAMTGDRGAYDVLTWRSGGPLILRAHRPVGRSLRVVARDERLDDYEAGSGSRFRYRRVVWNGARMTIADYGTVRSSEVPPPA